MDEEENPRDGARGEAGNNTPDDGGMDADADTGTDTDGAPSNGTSGGDGSADSSAAEGGAPPEDIDIQVNIGPDVNAPGTSDEDPDRHKDPDVGLDKTVLNDDEEPKGLFDGFFAGEPIFENKEVFHPSYTPHELPHRTDQVNQMAAILVSTLRGETSSNTLIYGETGTGRTAGAKFVSQELESISQKYDVPCEVECISCGVTDTQYRVLAQLANKFVEKNVERIEAEQERLDGMRTRAVRGPNTLEETPYDSITEADERVVELDGDADEMETMPMTGWLTDHVYTTFFDAIDYKGRVVVTMLDKIDKLIEKSGDDTLYDLSWANSELDNSRISIIGISNDLKFADFLDPRVESSLGEEEIIFPPYGTNQLHDTPRRRTDAALKPGALTDDVTPLCAALTAQEHGDARHALDLLRMADELAECGQVDTVEETHTRRAQDKIEFDRTIEVVHTLPTQSKIILFAIILLEEDGARNINIGEVFNIYKRLCEEIDADVLTQRHVTDLISELDMLGIIDAVVASKGRYGRTEEISSSIPIGETGAVLLTDSQLSDIESVQPSVQARFGD